MRGQLSIDFFLVMIMVIALSTILYNSAVSETGKAKMMDSIVLTKAFLEETSSAIDFTYFSGNQSSVLKQLYKPADASCLFFNSSQNAIYCIISSLYLEDNRNRVFGRTLQANITSISTIGSGCGSGWNNVLISNNGTNILVNCTAVQ